MAYRYSSNAQETLKYSSEFSKQLDIYVNVSHKSLWNVCYMKGYVTQGKDNVSFENALILGAIDIKGVSVEDLFKYL